MATTWGVHVQQSFEDQAELERSAYSVQCTQSSKVSLLLLCITSDQGGNFYSAMTRTVSCDQPFFIHLGQKIHILADPPHLIKSARNALLDHQIIIPEGRTNWEYIRKLYSYDRDQPTRMAPKLSQQHLDPPPVYGRMKVSEAAQVLSHTVTCALNACVLMDVLPAEALATAKYTEMMDKTPFKSDLAWRTQQA